MEGKEQLFRDKNVKPTEQLIAESLGEEYAIYQRFVETLKNEGISYGLALLPRWESVVIQRRIQMDNDSWNE